MAKLPRRPDPERLGRASPEIRTLDAGTRLYRIYSRGGPHPVSWDAFRRYGPVRSRFDHHERGADGEATTQERAVLYAALDLPSAFAEVFQHGGRAIDRHDRQPWVAAFDVGEPLELLDLTDTFALRAGASMKLMTDSVSVSQRWARAFHEAYPAPLGVHYRSSPTGRPCVALNERAAATIARSSALRLHRALSDPTFLPVVKAVAIEIGYDVL